MKTNFTEKDLPVEGWERVEKDPAYYSITADGLTMLLRTNELNCEVHESDEPEPWLADPMEEFKVSRDFVKSVLASVTPRSMFPTPSRAARDPRKFRFTENTIPKTGWTYHPVRSGDEERVSYYYLEQEDGPANLKLYPITGTVIQRNNGSDDPHFPGDGAQYEFRISPETVREIRNNRVSESRDVTPNKNQPKEKAPQVIVDAVKSQAKRQMENRVPVSCKIEKLEKEIRDLQPQLVRMNNQLADFAAFINENDTTDDGDFYVLLGVEHLRPVTDGKK